LEKKLQLNQSNDQEFIACLSLHSKGFEICLTPTLQASKKEVSHGALKLDQGFIKMFAEAKEIIKGSLDFKEEQ